MIGEEIIRFLAAFLAYMTLAILLYGLQRGTRRRAGRVLGRNAHWLGIPWFYLVTTLLFWGICYAGWLPLVTSPSPVIQDWLLVFGSLLYFPGMSLVLWGRLALGKNYFASTALAVRLFENHQLVTTGPYAIVRHPMYIGLVLAALGSLALFLTWTTLAFALCAPLLVLRARTEERTLALEFGETWNAYCRRVPMLIPRLSPRKALIPEDRGI